MLILPPKLNQGGLVIYKNTPKFTFSQKKGSHEREIYLEKLDSCQSQTENVFSPSFTITVKPKMDNSNVENIGKDKRKIVSETVEFGDNRRLQN